MDSNNGSVKPLVKRHKNDAADAEAIVVAAQRPEMGFVKSKSEQQQARAMLFRGRERLVHQRTELVNVLRAQLYEFGHTVPQGIGHLKRIEAIIEAPNSDLPLLVRDVVSFLKRSPRGRFGSLPRQRRSKLSRQRRTQRVDCGRCRGSAR